tara:strand:- start:232 stop:432 length:201 start_codon:yes stop_codon:yes gene_type:complete
MKIGDLVKYKHRASSGIGIVVSIKDNLADVRSKYRPGTLKEPRKVVWVLIEGDVDVFWLTNLAVLS